MPVRCGLSELVARSLSALREANGPSLETGTAFFVKGELYQQILAIEVASFRAFETVRAIRKMTRRTLLRQLSAQL